MSVQLLGTGAWLTVWGMGLVFLLLALLWGLVALLLRFDRPEPPGAAARPAAAPEALAPEVLAAVMVAVKLHVRALRKEAAPEARRHRPGSLPSRWVSAGRTRQNRSWSSGGRYT